MGFPLSVCPSPVPLAVTVNAGFHQLLVAMLLFLRSLPFPLALTIAAVSTPMASASQWVLSDDVPSELVPSM